MWSQKRQKNAIRAAMAGGVLDIMILFNELDGILTFVFYLLSEFI